jgi:DNA modification methylase
LNGRGRRAFMRKPDWQTADESIRLYCADCLDILPTLEAGSVDMIWTDPPFGHGNMDGDLQAARVRDGVKGARVREAEPIANDAGEGFALEMLGFLDEAARVLNRDCCCCCCMAGGGPTPTFARVSQWIDDRLEFFQAVVWDKSARGNGIGWRYRRNYEFVMVAHRKGGKLLWADNGAAVPNVVRHMPVMDRSHPNEKPAEMVADFIEWHTQGGMLVLDPFMGSGTTGVACIRTGRRFIGIEKEPKYFAIAVKRIEAELQRHTLFEEPPKIVQRSLIDEEAA